MSFIYSSYEKQAWVHESKIALNVQHAYNYSFL